jgi:hypothetical protein
MRRENDLLQDAINKCNEQIKRCEAGEDADWLPAYLAVSPVGQQLQKEFEAKLNYLKSRADRILSYAKQSVEPPPKKGNPDMS